MGILSAYLLAAWVLARRLGTKLRAAALVALAAAMLWGPGGLPLLGYVRAVTGDLSVPTLFLLAAGVLGLGPRVARTRAALFACAAAVAPLFYPVALGACRFQPYAWGFGEPALVAGLLALSLGLWIARFRVAAAVVMASSGAWQLGLGESRNLFDYLLDPLLAAASVGWAVRRLARRLRPSPAGTPSCSTDRPS